MNEYIKAILFTVTTIAILVTINIILAPVAARLLGPIQGALAVSALTILGAVLVLWVGARLIDRGWL